MQLKFASYNIHKSVGVDGKRDPERIISVLREIDADVIALQEADRRFGERETTLPRALLDDTKWKVVHVAKRARSLGWHGNALLVRRDIEIVDAHRLELPTLEPRGAVSADLSRDGKEFRVLGMHLDLSGLRRGDQIRAILHHCGERDHMPTVMMGDFNQWGRSRGVMRLFGKDWLSHDCGASFPSRRPIATLDRILSSRHWHGEKAHVHHSALAVAASDHLPVSAALELRA